jgi:hypothetical protein
VYLVHRGGFVPGTDYLVVPGTVEVNCTWYTSPRMYQVQEAGVVPGTFFYGGARHNQVDLCLAPLVDFEPGTIIGF